MDMKLLSAYESPFHFIVPLTSVLLPYIRHYEAPLRLKVSEDFSSSIIVNTSVFRLICWIHYF